MATETLRPNGVGSETAIPNQYPASGAHWDKVDDVSSDGDATYVYLPSNNPGGTTRRDLYALPDPSLSGVINKVTIYCRARQTQNPANYGMFYTSIRTNGVTYDGSLVFLKDSWQLIQTVYTLNPQTGDSWTWTEINALEAGVKLNVGLGAILGNLRCTQVYVEVDYTPAFKGSRGFIIG